MKKKKNQTSTGLSRRLHFPEDERRLAWLPLLLDAYAIADTGVAVSLRTAEKKHGKKLACAKGCGTCCVHQTDLPLYPHELVGIYWFVTEKLSGPARDELKKRLSSSPAEQGCPFLVENSCSIHTMRPVGCRQFNVLTVPCAAGEDPYFTRREDVLEPDQEYLDRTFAAVLPIYNMKKESELSAAIKTIRSQVMNLLSYDWSKLTELMEKNASDDQENRKK